MPNSMTGIGRCEGSVEGMRLAWRIRSVNQRFLEMNFRLPDLFLDAEPKFRHLIRERFARGSVELNLTVQQDGASRNELVLDEERVGQIIALEKKLRDLDGSHRGELSMDRLLSWSGVLKDQPVAWNEAELTAIRDEALSLLAGACDAMSVFRQREGEELEQTIRTRLDELEAFAKLVEEDLPRVREMLQKRLNDKVAQITDNPAEPTRMAQEVAFLLNKMDVSEELDRLYIHIREMRDTLDRDEPVGRRLDFLCQELNRESNTLCSKPQDPTISRIGVDMKVVIEKIREQVQNLE
ncbi:YicC/YloC family endoribonuclease [Magnetococcus sp. PR-3]|uniref:YicC/YloC family endoribonuclease n=1 Tax=Magnetococcus sp. PR-3 TaxID=3120355 RepID=UPI002FCE125F